VWFVHWVVVVKKGNTQADKAKAYDALKARAALMGYACVGYALDQVPAKAS
jgi:hypothetical protein